jgi:hypothetical protein
VTSGDEHRSPMHHVYAPAVNNTKFTSTVALPHKHVTHVPRRLKLESGGALQTAHKLMRHEIVYRC